MKVKILTLVQDLMEERRHETRPEKVIFRMVGPDFSRRISGIEKEKAGLCVDVFDEILECSCHLKYSKKVESHSYAEL